MADQKTITVGETAVGEPYTLPIEDVLTGRGFVTGKSGAGKSNTGSVIVEELLEEGHPVLVVDTDGEYWGLKESYEILHVGATEECDLQVGPEHASKLAQLALEQHVPIVLDVSGYVDADVADELVHDVAHELFVRENDVRRPFLLLVEEVHEYIPQSGSPGDVGEMLIRVAKRGRKRGLGMVGLSQRPASVDKDFITQADLLVWHRLTWGNDVDVVRTVIDAAHADEVDDLGDGEAFVQADWNEADVQRVQFRRKNTFDAGAAPGLDDVERPELKSIGEDLAEELEEISAEQDRRQDRIAELEARLEEKDDVIAEKEAEIERLRTADETLDLLTSRLEGTAGEAGGAVPDDVQERLEEKQATMAELREERDGLQVRLDSLQEEYEELADEVERLRDVEARVEQAERIEEQLERARDVLGVDVEEGGEAAVDEARVQKLQERVDELEAENDQLRGQSDAGAGGDDLTSLLNHEAVQAAIQTARERGEAGDGNYDPVLSVLATADGRALSASDIAAPLDISKRTVQRVVKALHSAGVVQTEGSRPTKYKLDREFIENRIEVARKQAEIAQGGA